MVDLEDAQPGYPPTPWALLAALGIDDAVAARPAGTGWGATELWRVRLSNRTDALLRVFPPGAGRDAAREAAAMAAARDGGIPAPAVLAADEHEGRPMLLLEWLPGETAAAVVLADPSRAAAVGDAMGRTLGTLAAVSPPRGVRRPGGWIAWAGPEETALAACLSALPPRPVALLHLDYHPRNVLVAEDAEGVVHVAGVLDWENANGGDPRAEVARAVSILRVGAMDPALPAGAGPALAALEEGLLRGHEASAGPLGDMAPFHAWAVAAMLRDLAPKLGRPGVWLRPEHLANLRHRLTDLKQAAGILSD
jgi:aminoglycoside phosphotransferase (APT) family kinase protein